MYKELKEKAAYYSENRRQEKALEIEKVDMEIIDAAWRDIFLWPAAIFTGIFALKLFTKNRQIMFPILRNPIAPGDRIVIKNKLWDQFLMNTLLFIGTLGSAKYFWAKYQFTKYFIFLKYEYLVDKYYVSRQLSLLRNIQQTAENQK